MRRAAQEFADKLCDLIEAALATREPAPAPAVATPAAAEPRPPAPSTVSARDSWSPRVLDFIREHPGAAPRNLVDELGIGRKRLFEVLARECSRGTLRKVGTALRVEYYVTDEPAPAASAGAPAVATAAPEPWLDRVVSFLGEYPGAAPRDIIAATGISRRTLFHVLGEAMAAGRVEKRDSAPNVAYHVADGGPPRAVPERSIVAPARSASPIASGDLVAGLAAFVTTHPGCRNSDLEAGLGLTESKLRRVMLLARAAGAVRLEGAKIKSRYYPAAPTAAREEHDAAPPAPTASDRRQAEALTEELEDALTSEMPPERLGIVVAAVVAELRDLRARVPDVDPLAAVVTEALASASTSARDRELGPIVGLGGENVDDWEHEALKARMRLAAFDRATEDEAAREARRADAEAARQRDAAEDDASEFPTLRRATREHPIVLVGGIKKNEVVEQIRRRYGLDVEWVAAQGANARAIDAFVTRVRRGRLGGVVLLEGLFGTTQIKTLREELKAAGVPFAFGDRAGTESIRCAFSELEPALAARAVGDD